MLHSLSLPDKEVYNVILFILCVHLQRQVVEPLRLCFHGWAIASLLYEVNRNCNYNRKNGYKTHLELLLFIKTKLHTIVIEIV